jgi:IclR family transcriptional regulator, acetate operon repressor
VSRVQSVERAFAVLSVLADGPIGVTEVADRAALPKSTAARLLASLATEEVVEQIPGETRWRLGPRIATLAASVRPTRSLVALARPHLADLATFASEAVGLSVPDGFTAHYVDQVDGSHPIGVRDWTGTRLPMHAVSAGLVFLAHLRANEVERYLASPLERFTARTVVEPELVRARLRRVQLEGVAWTRDEFADGLSSVAAPVTGTRGEVVAAVHVHGPSYRFPDTATEDALVDRLRATVARLSATQQAP